MASRPTPSPSPSPMPMPNKDLGSGDYSGFMWELGDFLFAAKSIAKLANGKGSWGDAAMVGVSAASLFFPPLKLGKLATPALKAVAVESEKMLATEVVSYVGKKELQKNIDNVTELLNVSPEERMTYAQYLEARFQNPGDIPTSGIPEGGWIESTPRSYDTPAIGKRKVNDSIGVDSNKTPGVTAPEYVEPVDAGFEILPFVNKYQDKIDESISVAKEMQDLLLTKIKSIKVIEDRTIAKGEDRIIKTSPLGKLIDAGDVTDATRFREAFQQRGVAEQLLASLNPRERKAYNELKKKHQEIQKYLGDNQDSFSEASAAAIRDGLIDTSDVTLISKYVAASKETKDIVKGAVPNAPKEMLSTGKASSSKLSEEAAFIRKHFDDVDELLTKQSRPVQKDIIDEGEAALAGADQATAGLNKSTVYAEDVKPKRGSKFDAADEYSGEVKDINPLDDIAATSGKSTERVGGSYSASVGELKVDVVRARKQLEDLKALTPEQIKEKYRLPFDAMGIPTKGSKIDPMRRHVKELQDANKVLKSAIKALNNKTGVRSSAVTGKLRTLPDSLITGADLVDDQIKLVQKVDKLIKPMAQTKGFGTTASKTTAVLDRIETIQRIIRDGAPKLRKSMLSAGKTEKQFMDRVATYKEELAKYEKEWALNNKQYDDVISKLDDVSKGKLSDWVKSLTKQDIIKDMVTDGLSKEVAGQRAFQSLRSEQDYLRRLWRLSNDTQVKDKLKALAQERKRFWDSRKAKTAPAVPTTALKGKIIRDVYKGPEVKSIAKEVKSTSDIVVHSGGAKGADTAWAEAADKAGILTQAHSFAGHETQGGFIGKRPALETRNILSKEQIAEQTPLLRAAQKVLYGSETVRTDTLGGKLVHRNAYQVKDSDAVLAVVSGFKKIHDGSRMTVGGRGTPWAVEMGIILKKPVFAFEQKVGKWFKFNPETKVWDELDGLPPKFKSFAGIGTASDLQPSGRKAIDDYMEQLSGKKVVAAAESKAEGSVVRWNKLTMAEQKDAVYIGRGSGDRGKFGNPFPVGNGVTVEEAVNKYRKYLFEKIKSSPEYAKELYALKGKKLACPGNEPNDACHGAVILRAIKYLEENPELMRGK